MLYQGMHVTRTHTVYHLCFLNVIHSVFEFSMHSRTHALVHTSLHVHVHVCRFYRWLSDCDELYFWSGVREFAERVFLVPAPPPGLLSIVSVMVRL